MAAAPIQPVIGDSGSDEVKILRQAFNHLLQVLLSASTTTIGNMQTNILADPLINQILTTREIATMRRFPTHT